MPPLPSPRHRSRLAPSRRAAPGCHAPSAAAFRPRRRASDSLPWRRSRTLRRPSSPRSHPSSARAGQGTSVAEVLAARFRGDRACRLPLLQQRNSPPSFTGAARKPSASIWGLARSRRGRRPRVASPADGRQGRPRIRGRHLRNWSIHRWEKHLEGERSSLFPRRRSRRCAVRGAARQEGGDVPDRGRGPRGRAGPHRRPRPAQAGDGPPEAVAARRGRAPLRSR